MAWQNDWKGLYHEAGAALLRRHLDSVHLTMMLFCMLYAGVPYAVALQYYSEFRGEAPERMHSYLCQTLLRRGLEIGPAELLTQLSKEVKHED